MKKYIRKKAEVCKKFEELHKNKIQIIETYNFCKKRFPSLFNFSLKPLKIGIKEDILGFVNQLLKLKYSKFVPDEKLLQRFLFLYVNHPDYKKMMRKATHRYDLSGRAVSEIDEHTKKKYAKPFKNIKRKAD